MLHAFELRLSMPNNTLRLLVDAAPGPCFDLQGCSFLHGDVVSQAVVHKAAAVQLTSLNLSGAVALRCVGVRLGDEARGLRCAQF